MCRSLDRPPRNSPLSAVLAVIVLLAAALAARAEDAPAWNEAAARHLLSRACFGGTPEEARRLAKRPLKEAVKGLLDAAEKAAPPKKPAWVRDVWINENYRYDDMSAEEYLVIVRESGARNTIERNELKAWWVDHMVRTETPLRETMTLFWHGHFTTASSKIGGIGAQALYRQNQTWRKHALGNFRSFLEAVTLDPAMLVYLDMEESTREHPNENYARELLELFTLGVGHYTEKDVLETARALTGWTLDAPEGSVRVARPDAPNRARSQYRHGLVPRFLPERHDTGKKTILGKSGTFGVKDVLDIVVAQPACAEHVTSRLIAFFGAHDPRHELRDRMATAFVNAKFEIRPMLEILFTSPEFYHPKARGTQVKSPVRLLVGACRDLRLDGEVTPPLTQLTVPMGQELFNPPTVKGWPSGTGWVSASTLALRTRLGETLVRGKEPGATEALGRLRLAPLSRNPEEAAATLRRLLQIDAERRAMLAEKGFRTRFDPARLASPGLTKETEKLADHLIAQLLVVPARSATRQALLAAWRDVPVGERTALAAIVLLASPEYQLE